VTIELIVVDDCCGGSAAFADLERPIVVDPRTAAHPQSRTT
jgi:hypothetical protein